MGTVGHIQHPGADMSTYLSTDVSHGRRRLLWMNATSQEWLSLIFRFMMINNELNDNNQHGMSL